ncbi:hypothetical protein ANO11243_033000 [Dothideomycetidae sp. 11243]|nr:hypothetical protein ANO11243_033000 [fungal sp. No.11243]
MSNKPLAVHSLPVLTQQGAEIACAAAQAKAKELGIDFNIALVDATLHLLHFTRMPNAKLTSIDIALSKAFTAAGHRVPTANYAKAEAVRPGGAAYSIHNSNGGRFSLIGGGVPITIDGQVVGAVGVSTGTPAQDGEVAQAGADAVVAWVKRSQGAKL